MIKSTNFRVLWSVEKTDGTDPIYGRSMEYLSLKKCYEYIYEDVVQKLINVGQFSSDGLLSLQKEGHKNLKTDMNDNTASPFEFVVINTKHIQDATVDWENNPFVTLADLPEGIESVSFEIQIPRLVHVPEKKYMLHAWGGMFNSVNIASTGMIDEYHGTTLFSTKDDREHVRTLLSRNYENSKELFPNNRTGLMFEENEGYSLSPKKVAHRVSKYKEEIVETTRDLPLDWTYDECIYYMQDKWSPGHNDYPFGERFDYDNDDFEVLEEWVEGSFRVNSK